MNKDTLKVDHCKTNLKILLRNAICEQQINKVHHLLDHISDVDFVTDQRDLSPLALASLGDKTEILEMLLLQGASVDATSLKLWSNCQKKEIVEQIVSNYSGKHVLVEISCV